MYSISKRVFNKAAVKYPQHKRSLLGLYQALRLAQVHSVADLQALFPSLQSAGAGDWQLDFGIGEPGLRIFFALDQGRIYVRQIAERELEASY